MTQPWLQVVLTAVFALCGLSTLADLRAAARPRDFVTHSWHLACCLAMVAMIWPWGMSLPVTPQAVVFGAAALWFLGLAAAELKRRRALIPNAEAGTTFVPWHPLGHCVAMLAMAWMLLAMAPAGMGAHSMHMPMAGSMDMSSMAMPMEHGAASPGSLPFLLIGVALCSVTLGTGLIQASVAVQRAASTSPGGLRGLLGVAAEPSTTALMTLGMLPMLFPMVLP